MKIAQWNYLGPRSTPQEIRDLRKASFDFHRTMGMPVIHKHRWTAMDLRDGKAVRCPYHDVSYDSGSSLCPYCFGTGFLGGWDDAAITFITIADAPVDTIKTTREGLIYVDTHPQFTAPWVPTMGDGDLIITADFDVNTWDILVERDRYTLQEVNPVTMRGFQEKVQTREYKVHQGGQIDKLPFGDFYYNVPLVFNYDDLPDPGPVPPGGDPDDFPTPGTKTLATSRGIRLIGAEVGTHAEAEGRVVKVTGLGETATRSTAIKVVGEEGGVIFHFDEY